MTKTEQLLQLLVSRYGFRSPALAEMYCRGVFGTLDLRDLTILDIGCGKGWLALYAGAQGARQVVGLEPEVEGSTGGDLREFRSMIETLGLDQVEARGEVVQEYQPGERLFDLVISRASVNHLDEEACIELRRSPQARERYLAIFRRIASLLRPGGTLILTDSSPHNFFALLQVTNPFAPRIEWHKHQSPRLWASLLREAGFSAPKITWKMPRALAPLGRLAANELVSFFLWSRFRLEMTRDPLPAERYQSSSQRR